MHSSLYTGDNIHLLIRIKAKKKQTQIILEEIYKTIAPTHKEEGCLEYKLMHDEDSIVIMGKWKNRMSLDMHLMLQFHVRLIEEILPPLCKKINIQSYKEIEPPITSLSLG